MAIRSKNNSSKKYDIFLVISPPWIIFVMDGGRITTTTMDEKPKYFGLYLSHKKKLKNLKRQRARLTDDEYYKKLRKIEDDYEEGIERNNKEWIVLNNRLIYRPQL